MRLRAAIAGGVTLLAVFALLGASAGAQGPEVTVTATVRIGSSCVLVSPTAIDFGTLEFSQPSGAVTATAPVTVRNCAAQRQTILARGSPATGGGITWTHAPAGSSVCSGPNLFIQGVRDPAQMERRLTTADQPVKSLPAGAAEAWTLTFVPPCTGSAGAGQAMTFTYTFTATADTHNPR